MHIHMDTSSVSLEQCIAVLEARRQCVAEALNGIAQPVAACDADFNTLLAERSQLNEALLCLRPVYRGEVRIPHPREDASHQTP